MKFEIKPAGHHEGFDKALVVSGRPKEKVSLVAKYFFRDRQSTISLTPKQALELARRLIEIAELSLDDE